MPETVTRFLNRMGNGFAWSPIFTSFDTVGRSFGEEPTAGNDFVPEYVEVNNNLLPPNSSVDNLRVDSSLRIRENVVINVIEEAKLEFYNFTPEEIARVRGNA